MTANSQRQRRTDRLHARRAADEMLIEAIFGAILLARLARPAKANAASAVGMPAAATVILR